MDDRAKAKSVVTAQFDESKGLFRGNDPEPYNARNGAYDQICRRTEISVRLLDHLRKWQKPEKMPAAPDANARQTSEEMALFWRRQRHLACRCVLGPE